MKILFKILLLWAFVLNYFHSVHGQTPNILLVIADDLGVDYMNGYHESNLLPTTPVLDNLRANGITFNNVFSTPKCTPSRATIMSGKHGIKTGVQGTPGNLDTTHLSLFRAIEAETNGLYSDAVIGKWHISHPADANHPSEHGVDFYTGLLTSLVSDYYAWEHTENGATTIDSTYVTTALTNASIDWVNKQNTPWFLWLAHVAPHGPFHVPPDSLYSIGNTANNARKYVAMIEGIDHELGRLLANIPQEELDNTIIIFIGDNGTPVSVLQDYPDGYGKGTLYQGGIRVPMIVSGAGVTRKGERENALVHITDIYATLLEVVGADLPGGIYNSLSFKHLLDNSSGNTRDYNFSESVEGAKDEFTIRNNRYKLIESNVSGDQQFFDLLTDSLETSNLIGSLDVNQQSIKEELEKEAEVRRTSWSCNDHIQNGDEEGIDCGGTFCNPCRNMAKNGVESLFLDVYPNPTRDELHLDLLSETYDIKLTDNYGRIVLTRSSENEKSILSLKHLVSGTYILILTNVKSDERFVGKVMLYR